jgi:hypothetical protein
MTFRVGYLLVVSLFLTCGLCVAQVRQPPAPKDASALMPTVTFELFWEQATPQRYAITVDVAGNARYESHTPERPAEGRSPTPSEPDDFETQFIISRDTRDQILRLAKELDYFNGDWDFKKHVIANTGQKTLTWSDAGRKSHTTYNFSESKPLQQLTSIFEGISLTLEHGRKLQFLHRFDKLGLESELNGMEEMFKRHDLYELQLIAPTLRKIANDTAVLHLARQRAGRLLAAGAGAESR